MTPIRLVPDASVALAWLLGRTDIWRVYQLARTHGLTTYDASYVELAWRNNACLATFDRKLADAARASGIAVYGQPHGVAEPIARYG